MLLPIVTAAVFALGGLALLVRAWRGRLIE